MAQQSNIVAFDDVRRTMHASSRRRSSEHDQPVFSRRQDSENLNNIFKLDFGEEAFSSWQERQDDGVPRSAIFSEEDLIEEESGQEPASQGVFASWSKKWREARKARSKSQAERAFERSYGGDEASFPSEGAPRAALHEPKITSSQKKAARVQGRHGSGASGAFAIPGLSRISLPQLSSRFKRNAMALIFAFFAVMLVGSIYTPAQQYYQQVRERDRLSAEYAAVQERNDALQSTVDYLSTEDGLEDKAHTEFGLIKPDEETASVIGIDVDASPDFHANVAPGSVAAPETWYSGVLDILFAYDRG